MRFEIHFALINSDIYSRIVDTDTSELINFQCFSNFIYRFKTSDLNIIKF